MINIPVLDSIIQNLGASDTSGKRRFDNMSDETGSVSFLDVMTVETSLSLDVKDQSFTNHLAMDMPQIDTTNSTLALPEAKFGGAIQQPETAQNAGGELLPASDFIQNDSQNGADINTVLRVNKTAVVSAGFVAATGIPDGLPKAVDLSLNIATQRQTPSLDAVIRPVKETIPIIISGQIMRKPAVNSPAETPELHMAGYAPVKDEPETSAPASRRPAEPDLKAARTPVPEEISKAALARPIDLSELRPAPTQPPADEGQSREKQTLRGAMTGTEKPIQTGSPAFVPVKELPGSMSVGETVKDISTQLEVPKVVAADNPRLQAKVSLVQPTPAPPENPARNTLTNSRPNLSPITRRVPIQTAPDTVAQTPIAASRLNPIPDLLQTNAPLMLPPNLKVNLQTATQPLQVHSIASPTPPQQIEITAASQPEASRIDAATPNAQIPTPISEQAQTVQVSTDTTIPEQMASVDDAFPLVADPRLTDASTSRLETFAQRPEMARHVAQQLTNAAQQMPDRPIELTLNPEELGRVRLTFTLSDGNISVAVMAERGETMDLMRRHIDTLAQEFRNQGYKDVNFEFSRGGQHSEAGSGGDESRDRKPADHDALITSTQTESDSPTPIKLSLEPPIGLDLRL